MQMFHRFIKQDGKIEQRNKGLRERGKGKEGSTSNNSFTFWEIC